MKRLTKLFCVALCIAIGCIFAACGNTEKQHSCAYTAYGHDEVQHWKYCPGDNNIDPDSYEAHVESGTCVCGYVVPEKHTCAYTSYGHDEVQHWKYCPDDNNIDPDSYEAHVESGTCVCGYVVPKKTVLKYTFTGDERTRAGYAEGTVEIIPANGIRRNSDYKLYWGDDDGIFSNYYELGRGRGSGASLTIPVGENIAIPRGATKIYATENGRTLVSADIPAEKRYTAAPALTFASVSDVHVNYPEGGDFWTNALNEYQKAGVQYVIISGDLTSDGSQFPAYKAATENSNYTGLIFSSIGNHEQQAAGRAGNFKYAIYDGAGKVWVELDKAANYFDNVYAGDLNVTVNWFDAEGGSDTYYYYALIENNLYVFMDQMLSSTGNSSNQDNFSATQLDWVENVLNYYG